MNYWILPASGISVSRKMLQCVKYIDTCTNVSKKPFELYDKAIKEILYEKYTEEDFVGPNSTKSNMEMWDKLAEDDEDFQSDFN